MTRSHTILHGRPGRATPERELRGSGGGSIAVQAQFRRSSGAVQAQFRRSSGAVQANLRLVSSPWRCHSTLRDTPTFPWPLTLGAARSRRLEPGEGHRSTRHGVHHTATTDLTTRKAQGISIFSIALERAHKFHRIFRCRRHFVI